MEEREGAKISSFKDDSLEIYNEEYICTLMYL